MRVVALWGSLARLAPFWAASAYGRTTCPRIANPHHHDVPFLPRLEQPPPQLTSHIPAATYQQSTQNANGQRENSGDCPPCFHPTPAVTLPASFHHRRQPRGWTTRRARRGPFCSDNVVGTSKPNTRHRYSHRSAGHLFLEIESKIAVLGHPPETKPANKKRKHPKQLPQSKKQHLP